MKLKHLFLFSLLSYSLLSYSQDTEEIENPGTNIYSNYKTLFIETPKDTQLSIFDYSGRLFLNKHITQGLNSINIKNSGIYLVKLTGNDKSVIRKVFIE